MLPILTGYCYGPTFGFLLGSLSLLVSALIGGGVGPWLPYQMFATGWMGMLSGVPARVPERTGGWEPVMLAVWGVVLGLIFGAIMNIWFWPFMQGGDASQAAGGVVPAGHERVAGAAQLRGVLHGDVAVVGCGTRRSATRC